MLRPLLGSVWRDIYSGSLRWDMIRIMSDAWTDVFADAREHALPAGTVLFHRGDPVRHLFLVREGRVALRRSLRDGGSLTLDVAEPGKVVAIGSLFSDVTHCDAVCRTDSRLASRPVEAVLDRLGTSPAVPLLADSAHEVQALRARVEVLRLHGLSDRLDAYLELYGAPVAGGWVRVADWIGVSAAALYRELGRRRSGQ